ncbi:hypothetical protein ACLMJK_007549 [Lecanora helva]
MKILESQSAVLTNYEVLAHLASTAAKPRTAPQTHQNVSTLLKELTDYLSPPSTSRSPVPPYASSSYSPASLRTLIKRLEPYKLTKAETLAIINLRPKDPSLLDCVVEECDERFDEGKQEEILAIVGEVLGRDEEGGEERETVAGGDEEVEGEGEGQGGEVAESQGDQ